MQHESEVFYPPHSKLYSFSFFSHAKMKNKEKECAILLVLQHGSLLSFRFHQKNGKRKKRIEQDIVAKRETKCEWTCVYVCALKLHTRDAMNFRAIERISSIAMVNLTPASYYRVQLSSFASFVCSFLHKCLNDFFPYFSRFVTSCFPLRSHFQPIVFFFFFIVFYRFALRFQANCTFFAITNFYANYFLCLLFTTNSE